MNEYDLTSHPTQYRSFRGRPFQAKCTQKHSNGTVRNPNNKETESLTFTETQKRAKPKIVRTFNYYMRAYVINIMVVLIGPNLSCYPPDSHQSHNAVYFWTRFRPMTSFYKLLIVTMSLNICSFWPEFSVQSCCLQPSPTSPTFIVAFDTTASP